MSYIYNRTFKIGVIVGVIVFVLLNIATYYFALKRQEANLLSPIQFAPNTIDWGFPFNWGRSKFFYPEDGILNVLVGMIFGISCGIIFNYIGRRRSFRSV